MAEGSKLQVQSCLEKESAIDQWWEAHKKALKQTIEEYKTFVSVELRRTQVQLARVTEERDLLIKKLVEANRTISRMKEILRESGF